MGNLGCEFRAYGVIGKKVPGCRALKNALRGSADNPGLKECHIPRS